MNKALLFILLFLASSDIGLAQSKATMDKERKAFIEGGFSMYISEDTYAGLFLAGGYHVSPRLRLEFNFCTYFYGEQIGTFSYTLNSTGSTIHNDGEINRNYNITPLFATLMYTFDLSPKVHFLAGPSLGLTTLWARDSYSPSGLDGEPSSKFKKNEVIPTAGLGIGLSFDVGRRAAVNVGYKLLFNEKIDFELVTINNATSQLNFTFSWKF